MINYNILDDEVIQNMLLDDSEEQDYKKRQGNYSQPQQTQPQDYDYSHDTEETEDGVDYEAMPQAFDANAAPQTQETQATKTMSMFDLVKADEPAEDKGVYKRTQKAALMDTIGKAFGSLAGAIGQVKGAHVPLIPDNQNLKAFYSIADRERERYKALKQSWDSKKLQAKMYDAQNDLAERRLQAANDLARAKEDADNKRWALTYDQNERKMKADAGLKAAALQSRDAYQKGRLAVDVAKLNKETDAERKQNEFFTWRNPYTGRDENPYNPNATSMSRSEFDDVYNQAVYEYGNVKGQDNLKALMGQYQNNPLEAKREVVKWYLDSTEKQRVEQAKAASDRIKGANLDKEVKKDLNYDVRKYWQGDGAMQKPSKQEKPQAEEEIKIDFENLIL